MSVPPPPHAALPGSPLGLVLPTQQRTKTEVVRGVFPSCSSSLNCACAHSCCLSSHSCVQQFTASYRCQDSLLVQPTIHSSPLALRGEDSSWGFIMHVYMYIERAVPAADIHTVKDCKLHIRMQVDNIRISRWRNSVSAQATAENLYMCTYKALGTASIPKACMYIHYITTKI